jgi:hypothetical protein
MSIKSRVALGCVALLLPLCAATVPTPEDRLTQACTKCHGLGVIRAQRLTRAEWSRELDKMAAMGAKVTPRKPLLDYLAKKYGPQK